MNKCSLLIERIYRIRESHTQTQAEIEINSITPTAKSC